MSGPGPPPATTSKQFSRVRPSGDLRELVGKAAGGSLQGGSGQSRAGHLGPNRFLTGPDEVGAVGTGNGGAGDAIVQNHLASDVTRGNGGCEL